MKKRILWIGSFMILPLLLVACGDNDEVENPPQNDTGEEQQHQADENSTNVTDNTDTNTNTEYGFTKFDLEADYEDTNDALDVDYENEEKDKMEASYRNKSQDIDLNGDQAMEELDSIFSSFNFDESTPEEEVLNAITEAFNIPEEAQNLELEIEFSDGTEKEYRK
ncbi:YusW family protein [Oceanobacillus kapialis]|uniref:YusW family protein n=1 Tax=Oceanobacillus kapialis TaxID=481353 RepID=UPI003850DEE8